MYSKLCAKCAEKFPEFPDETNPEAKPHTFKRLLLNKCQEEFEKENSIQEQIDALGADATDAQKAQTVKAVKTRMLGNIRFIGELYKQRMLTEKIMHECLIKLLGDIENPEEDEVECLCKLMSTIGQGIDHAKAKPHMDEYFSRMYDMSQNSKSQLPNRLRFMLQEVIDLRKSGWKANASSAMAGKEAKTRAEVQKEALAEERALLGGHRRRRPVRPGRPGAVGGGGRIPRRRRHPEGDAARRRRGAAGARRRRAARPRRGAARARRRRRLEADAFQGRQGRRRRGGELEGGGAGGAAADPKLTKEQLQEKLEKTSRSTSTTPTRRNCSTTSRRTCRRRRRWARATTRSARCSSRRRWRRCSTRGRTSAREVATLFKPLAEAKLCPPAELKRAFELALEFIDDEVIDVPMIARYMAQFIARAVADKLLPLAFIADGFAHLVDASSVTATKMAVEVLKALSEDVGDADATALYRDSKVDLSKLLPPADAAGGRAAVAALLEKAGLGFYEAELVEANAREAAAASRAALLASLETHLVAELKKEPPADTEALGEWLRSQTIDAAAAPLAARAIMKCVLETAREDPFKMTPILSAIMNRAKLLRLASQPDGADAKVVNVLQANLCWEVQAFCHANGWPTELIKKIFFQLYEKDAVFEDGFLHWKEDLDDATPGKEKALFQLIEFFTWLETADEEDEAGEG